MNKDFYCVIMAGGVGARFWPMSKTSHPKQFIDILGSGRTLLQQTYDRFVKVCNKENIYIVTNDIYNSLVLDQLPEIKQEQVLCEPSRRNTAPCIAYANYKIAEKNPNATIVVAPSDHVVLKEDVFTEIILTALNTATKKDWLITLGIKPSRPDTGYGYIQFNESIGCDDDDRIKKVKTFTEKPIYDMAVQFIQSGDFLWNSGMFIWSLKNIMNAFNTYLPEVDDIFKEGLGKYNKPEEKEFIQHAYSICKGISIDYGIMEKAENVYVIAADFGWSDLGTWGSLYENRDKDSNLNTVVGKSVFTYDTKNCIVNMPHDKVVVIQGLDDYIVVDSENVLLICKKQDEQQIKNFVNDVKTKRGEQFI